MRATAFASLLVFVGAATAAEKPLECPAGAQLERSAGIRGDRLEICKDAKSGAQHGPGRLFDSKNRVMMEFVNDAGRETSRQFTPAGVARYIDDVNAAKREAKLPWRYEIADARTLRYIVTFEPQGDAPLDEKKVHADVSKDQPCLLMLLPGATFEKIEMRVQRPGGKIWFRTTIAREECVPR